MSMNWKKYLNDPKYLIALLPGLEIARDNMNEEIESIRAAISGKHNFTQPANVTVEEPQQKKKYTKQSKRAKHSQPLLTAGTPGFDSTGMMQHQFIAAVCRMHGGTATNAQIRAEAALHPVFTNLTVAPRLATAISGAIYKHRILKRVAQGTLKAL